MERLKVRDLRALLDFLRRCYAAQDLDEFVAALTSGLADLIPADITGYAEADLQNRWIRLRGNPADFLAGCPLGTQGAERHIEEQPVVAYYLLTGDQRAYRISDFVTHCQLHRLGLYNDFYRPLGIEYQLSVPVVAEPHVLTRITCSRNHPDFSDRERLLLNLVRPHIAEARRNAETLTLLKQGGGESGPGLLITEHGRVGQTDARSLALVQEYFGPVGPMNRLPPSLERWIKHQEGLLEARADPPPPRQSLVVERQGKRLTVRLLPGPVQRLLILQEQRTSLHPASLEPLGLTHREGEVLAWVARGKTNDAIATIFGLSYRTVEKHLENILRKLGVENRTAAATRALAVAKGVEG